jgi:cytosine/adenosine deaminase-related metal-dependent hydrolase
MPATCDLLISNARVLHCREDKLETRHILISGGRITAMPAPSSGLRIDAGETIDACDGLVMPGLVNAHTHSPENLARGTADCVRLSQWLDAVWPRIDTLAPDRVRLAVELGAAEMIRRGVTSVVDHFRQTPMRPDALQAAVAAYTATGLRTTLAVMLRDGRSPGGALVGAPHVAAAPDAAQQIALVAAMAGDAGARGVTLAYGPSAPHRCSDALLEQLAGLPGDTLVHTHLDETAEDADAARRRFGRSNVAHLQALGLLRATTACAHAVHVTEDDIVRLAASEAVVVHNPVSNMRLGSGTAPVASFLAAGIRIALGTDGAASNDTQDLWESIKLAALLPRLGRAEPHAWPSSATVLDMATRQGHGATGLSRTEPLAGTIAVGAPADLIVFDDDPLALHSLLAPASSMVLGTRREPRHVIARGRFLMRDRALVTIDETDLRQRLRFAERSAAA